MIQNAYFTAQAHQARLRIIILLFLLLIFRQSYSQNAEYKNTLCLNMGFSLVGGVMNIMEIYGKEDWTVSAWRQPAFGFTYDHGTRKWFSVGFAFSTQQMGFKLKEDTFIVDVNQQKVPVILNVGININRLSFSFRPMFHYANKGNWDLYSGFRVGLTIWHLNVSSDQPDLGLGSYLKINEWMNKKLNLDLANLLKKKTGFNITSYGYQLVVFGARAHLVKNFGINAELCIGSPHFFSFGLTYRLKTMKKTKPYQPTTLVFTSGK